MERLNKYLARAGVASRRQCDELILAGRVKINGVVVRELGTKIDPQAQKVSVDDDPVRAEKLVYWAVHKPAGVLCTNRDPAGRPTAQELIPHVEQRVYTVGRLDESSEGLLLMTNDGPLAHGLMHPRFEIEKTYLVLVAGRPSPEDLQQLLDGVWIAEGKVKAKQVRRLKPQGDSTWLKIVLNEGKNREIRRMLAKLKHKVLQLRRVAIGTIQLDRLPRGKSRKLTVEELQSLQRLVKRSQARAVGSEDDPQTFVTEPLVSPRSMPSRPTTRRAEPGRTSDREGAVRPGSGTERPQSGPGQPDRVRPEARSFSRGKLSRAAPGLGADMTAKARGGSTADRRAGSAGRGQTSGEAFREGPRDRPRDRAKGQDRFRAGPSRSQPGPGGPGRDRKKR